MGDAGTEAVRKMLGFESEGRNFARHSGSVKGFGADLANYFAEDLVVAIAANSYNAPAACVVFADFFLQTEADK